MSKYIFNDNSLKAFWDYITTYLAKKYAAITSKVDNVSYSGGTLSIATTVLNEKGEPTGKTTAVVTAAKIVTDGGGITSHQDISGKADKSATVSTVAYDTTNKKLTKTINGTTSEVVTAAKIVSDGGGVTKSEQSVTASNAKMKDVDAFVGDTVSISTSSGVKSVGVVTSAHVSRNPTGQSDDIGLIPTWDGAKEVFATKASPAFTGTPTAPTAAAGTNSTQIATTAFVKTAVDNAKPGSASTNAAGIVKLQTSIDNTSTTALTPSAVNAARGSSNGLCPLGADSKVPTQYLPSYVDDVVEVYPLSGKTQLAKDWLSATQGGTPIDPESGKIYVLVGTATGTTYPVNSQFRWPSGSNATAYVPILDATGFTEITKTEIEQICV